MNKLISIKQRFNAITIDISISFIVYYSLSLSFTSYIKQFFFYLPPELLLSMNQYLLKLHYHALIIVSMMISFIAYFLADGKTFGKSLVGIQVIRKNNAPSLDFRTSLIRAFLHGLNMTLFFIPSIIFYLVDREKSFIDILSQTVTVQEGSFKKSSTEDLNSFPEKIKRYSGK